MKIHEVQENLRNTIAGKEKMLAGLKDGGDAGQYTLRHMLNLNIDELKRILQDVEACKLTYTSPAVDPYEPTMRFFRD